MNSHSPEQAADCAVLEEDRIVLKKSLSPFQVWTLALGCILGWGCFVLPGIRFLPQAGPIAACIGFILGAGLLAFIALSYGKMIEYYPVAGGEFAYAYAGFGPTAAFICGWALALGYTCIIALNATAIALLTRFLLPGLFEWGYMYTIAGWDVYAGELMLLSGAVLLFGFINYRGVSFAGGAQAILALILVTGVVVFCCGSFFAPTAHLDNLRPFFAQDVSPLGAVASIVAIAPWLYVGFDTIPQAAEEFDFPPNKSTFLMVAAILLGGAIYALVTLGVGVVLPYPELLAANHVWTTGYVANFTLGSVGSIILALTVLAAILTGINGFYIATSRLLFGMARAKFLPECFNKIHPEHHCPHCTVVFTMIVALTAPWFGREALNWVVDMSAIGTVIAYGFTAMTAYRFMAAHPTLPGSGRDKVYAVIGVCTSLLCLGLLTIPGSPAAIAIESWYALLVWCGLGAIFYMVRRRDLKSMKTEEFSALILGKADMPVFFKQK